MDSNDTRVMPRSNQWKQWPHIRRTVATKILPRIVLVVMCLVYLFPFYQMIITSLKSTAELGTFPPTIFPHHFVWKNYSDAVRYITFFRFTLNSLILAAGVTLGSILSNSVIANGFSRIRWPGRDKLFFLALASIFIPFPVTIVALFDIFAKIHWINTYLPIIVPAFFGQAFNIFLMRQFLMEIPKEISEAATIDGSNEMQTFLIVILPLLRPAIAVVAIFSGVGAWNDFLTPLLFLNDEKLYPLSIGLQFFRSEHNVAYSMLMSASTLVVLPLIVLFLAFQRFFIEGVTVGSIKG
jgi:multiple sugar transport system permease protein